MTLIKSSGIVFFVTASLLIPLWLDAQSLAVFPFQVRSSGGYLGVNLADIDADRGKELKLPELTGVEIVSVVEGTPAFQAGLRPSDVVISYNGEKVLGVSQLARLVSETPPNRRVNLVCWRKGEEKRMTVTTGSIRVGIPDDVTVISAYRVTDVPSNMLIWRDLVLGIESESISDQLAQNYGVKQGVLIWNVASGSPAQHAGLRAGDILTDFCGHAVHSPRDVGMVLQQMQNAQKPVSANLMRDHKQISVSLSLNAGER